MTEHVDTPGGPAGRRGLWHETLSRFDLHVTYIPGRCNTLADPLSRWAYPASEAYSELSFHGTSTDKSKMIEFDKEEQALIRKHCLQCSIKNRMKVKLVRCKEITKADQTERVTSDSESSLPLLNVFPLTRSKAKSNLPPQINDRGVRAWGPVTNPTARALASWLCALWGRHEGDRGGRLLPGCGASGVGRSPTPNCPPSGRAVRGQLPTGCGCGGVRAWGPVTNPTARALASWLCALWGRHEGARGGRLLPGCGASRVGRSPTPDSPPSGRAAGAHYPLALGAGGCGRGDPSPTPQRALLRAVGAA